MKAILIQLFLGIVGVASVSSGHREVGAVFIVGSFVVMALRQEKTR